MKLMNMIQYVDVLGVVFGIVMFLMGVGLGRFAFQSWKKYRNHGSYLRNDWKCMAGTSIIMLLGGVGIMVAASLLSHDVTATIQRDYKVTNIVEIVENSSYTMTDEVTNQDMFCQVTIKGDKYSMNCLGGAQPTRNK